MKHLRCLKMILDGKFGPMTLIVFTGAFLLGSPSSARQVSLLDTILKEVAGSDDTGASSLASSSKEKRFLFHVPNEPRSIDPARLTSTDANYFFGSIMRGLFKYDDRKGLVPEGAKSCVFSNKGLQITCSLDPTAKWSDGKVVEASEYVRSFRRLAGGAKSATKNPTVELLKNVKNALAIHRGEALPESLGASAPKKDRLVIDLSTNDPDFLYKLTAAQLVPSRIDDYPEREKAHETHFNGPYAIKAWVPGRRILLEKNPHYQKGHPDRPIVEILFIDDDQTALNLYEEGTLTFLRRLASQHFDKYKDRPDFHWVPIARFDYLGFGEDLADQPDLRAALSLSADYRELQKLYESRDIPGCPSLPERMLDKKRCVKFDLAQAKKHLAKVPSEWREKRLKLHYSMLGGDDHKNGMEWFQAQWKKNLGIIVDLQPTEQGVFLNLLRTRPPHVFRKGVGLERPTCLAALETFAVGGAENFLKLDSREYRSRLERLARLKAGGPESRQACGKGVQYLIDRHLLVPLGRIDFKVLAKPEFTGWRLNEMNQLDLSQLHYRTKR